MALHIVYFKRPPGGRFAICTLRALAEIQVLLIYMQIDVVQWNVWYKEDIDNIVSVLRDLDADVVCLQELTQGYVEQSQDNTWEHIQRELGYYGVHQTIPITTDTDGWIQANAIFSRHPILAKYEHWLHTPSNVEATDDQFRGYIEGVVEFGGVQYTFGTTHMSFSEYEDGHDPELKKLLHAVRKRDRRFILTGDLNATPESERIRELASRLVHAGPPYEQNTWTTKPHKTPLFEAATLDWRYDYVFTSADMTVVDAQTVQTNVSDHLPIRVTLQLPGPS